MNSTLTLRLADPSDSEAILAIYTPYILNSPATFECEPPSAIEFSQRIRNITTDLPWLVCEYDQVIIAYTYAGKHRTRAAYQWSVESSVYVLSEYQRKGIARILYSTLFSLLQFQGIVNVYAGITLPNEKSEAFHLSAGFSPIGIYKNIGYKLGKWHDVKWYELTLGTHKEYPSDPVSIKSLFGTTSFEKIMEGGNDAIRKI